MASRAIESRSSRIITILINPFMSCSARLPIFGAHWHLLLRIACRIGDDVSMYLVGILAAVVTARLLRRFLFRKDETPFVMELPPYRMPTMSITAPHLGKRCAVPSRKWAASYLFASIVVWALNYFPLDREEPFTPEEYALPPASTTLLSTPSATPTSR